MSEPAENKRYVSIDALRGVAAMAVLLHHLLHSTLLEVTLRKVLPGTILWICGHGAEGVEVFSVISGFVIAHSLRNTTLTPGAVGNFALRCQLRLDPPYWVALLVVLLLNLIENRLPELVPKPTPKLGDFILNCLYLQNILGVPQILNVAWTLCLEVQFYVAFIAFLFLGQRLYTREGGNPSIASILLIFLTGIASLAFPSERLNFNPWTYILVLFRRWSLVQLVSELPVA